MAKSQWSPFPGAGSQKQKSIPISLTKPQASRISVIALDKKVTSSSPINRNLFPTESRGIKEREALDEETHSSKASQIADFMKEDDDCGF